MAKEIRIPKRNGKFRTIVVPSKRQKQLLKDNVSWLETIAIVFDVYDVQHGFTPGRSPVTNALPHVGYAWTVSIDLADCFDHVTIEKVKSVIGEVPRQRSDFPKCFYKGVARQGLPTSPALANIALSPLDKAVVELLAGRGVYTRYADDLSISSDSEPVAREMMQSVPSLAAERDFPVNPAKTKLQSAKGGRRHITGVAVGDDWIYPKRRHKRRLRAALHQRRKRQAQGLAEWCKLKPPSDAVLAQLLASDREDDQTLAMMAANRP